MFNFLRKKSEPSPLSVDIHSHLLPGLDDGVESFDESLEIIRQMHILGYEKLITTPHIMQDFYNNSADNINASLKLLNDKIEVAGFAMRVEAAAEYYLDDYLMTLINDEQNELLTFGDNYLLFETSFMNEPLYLNEFIFKAKSRGINPVLAHPERYAYIHSNFEMVDDLINRGVCLQLNLNSLSGYYSRQVKKTAEKLIDSGNIHFLGSDCHNYRHLEVLKESRKEKYYERAMRLPLINHSLL